MRRACVQVMTVLPLHIRLRPQRLAAAVFGRLGQTRHVQAAATRDPRDAVVKIFNTRQRPGWTVPWQDQPVESTSGSGAVIATRLGLGSEVGRAVLTAAHVIADSRYLQVQRTNDRFGGEKFRAHVVAVCHEIDLALLRLEEEEVLEEMEPLVVGSATELPRVFDKVRVVGYPIGGDACSVTEGVVSRVEVQEYSHSLRFGLALTVDAAINSGNSGGPLVDALSGHVVGVAFQKMVARGVELQGHAVPAPVIQRFLEDVASSAAGEGSPVRLKMPSLGCDYQSLEPPALRQSLGLDELKGILISRLHHADPGRHATGLAAGDVLLTFNGHKLDELGFADLFGRRLHFGAARDLCRVGSAVEMEVWRGGARHMVQQVLRPAQHLVPRGQYDVRPRFFIVGGLVFQALSNEYLQGWAAHERPAHLQELFIGGHATPERNEAVILAQILADLVNAGYDSGWVGAPVVSEVNGTAVRNLSHFVQLVEAGRQNHALPTGRLEIRVLLGGGPFRIVLPLKGLDEADERIQRIYGLPRLGSETYERS
ncbi:Protease Do-like 10 [Durusdinium trenchii]|uniref:Mitochondrial n=1 Tax=Durusdinium trenchii TaxID=1381693 RepID=A0ABP0QCP5_9DINO